MTKESLYTREQTTTARLMKALAHPARIAIIEHLIQVKTCVCGDIVNEIGLAQATISQHLKELKTAGLIKGTIEGTSVCYCIHQENWNAMSHLIKEFVSKNISATQDCC
jgi:DNA-binding transcriptional ArsR family regulator